MPNFCEACVGNARKSPVKCMYLLFNNYFTLRAVNININILFPLNIMLKGKLFFLISTNVSYKLF